MNGGFKIVIVQPANWNNPSLDLTSPEFKLKAGQNEILHIPGGIANGFKAFEPDSKLVIFSDFKLEDCINDDFRFDQSIWYDWSS